MKTILFLLAMLPGIAAAQIKTLDDFLQAGECLKKTPDEVEMILHLEPGALKTIDDHYNVLGFGDVRFSSLNLAAFVGYRAGQIKDISVGASSHESSMSGLRTLFQELHNDLQSRYGDASAVRQKQYVAGENRGPCNAYVWVNEKYSLILALFDDKASNSLKMSAYHRNETNGEFGNDPECYAYLKDLYDNHSGKLPDNWGANDEIGIALIVPWSE